MSRDLPLSGMEDQQQQGCEGRWFHAEQMTCCLREWFYVWRKMPQARVAHFSADASRFCVRFNADWSPQSARRLRSATACRHVNRVFEPRKSRGWENQLLPVLIGDTPVATRGSFLRPRLSMGGCVTMWEWRLNTRLFRPEGSASK